MNKTRSASKESPDTNLVADALRALSVPERRLVTFLYSRPRAHRDHQRCRLDERTLEEGLRVERSRLGKHLATLGRKLLAHPVELRDPSGSWVVASWLPRLEYDVASGIYTFSLQSTLSRLVRDFSRCGEGVSSAGVLALKGKYSRRLLELLIAGRDKAERSTRWEVSIPIETFRTAFSLDDRYTKPKALKKWVIVESLNEINLADLGLRVEVETVLHKKKTRAFLFRVERRKAGG